MSNIAFLFLPLAFSSLPAVLPFVSPSSQVGEGPFGNGILSGRIFVCARSVFQKAYSDFFGASGGCAHMLAQAFSHALTALTPCFTSSNLCAAQTHGEMRLR